MKVRMALPWTGRGYLYIPNPGWDRNTRNQMCGSAKLFDFDRANERWEVSRQDFNKLRDSICAHGYGVTEFRQSMGGTAKCDTRCVEAKGDKCVCSCLGVNHRGGTMAGVLVGETTLITPGELYWIMREYPAQTNGDEPWNQ